jgi:hypothetical protein
MNFRSVWLYASLSACVVLSGEVRQCQVLAQSSSSSTKEAKRPAVPAGSGIDLGAVVNGIYRNKTLGFTCKIPAGWVLRTDEMNAPEEKEAGPEKASAENPHLSQNQGEVGHPSGDGDQTPHPVAEGATRMGQPTDGRVLLAAFSRPPEAHGEAVNASIVIAAEPVTTYPGLKEAAQYFGPLTEVAKAQGFTADEEPYEIAIGTKTLVRGDFHKDMGTRVMRQSTLAMLEHGYAVSFTVIGGTEDEVEELVDELDFATSKRAPTR